MKARNKVTRKVVSNFGWSEEYGAVCYTDEDGNVRQVRRTDEWELLNDVDWAAYRMAAAKDILCAILRSNQTDDNDKPFHTFEDLAKASVACADALIAKLQSK